MAMNIRSRNATIDLIKWVGVGLIFYDHYLHLIMPGYMATPFRWVGLSAYPIFLYAFAFTGKRTWATARFLIVWGLVAQVGFTYVLEDYRLNILFAFAAGLLPFPYMLCVAVFLGRYMDGGLYGILATWFAIQSDVKPPDLGKIKIPPARWTGQIYALHFWVLWLLTVN